MLLAMDASGTIGSVALGCVKGSKVEIAGLVAIPSRAASAELIPRIRSLLLSSAVTVRDIQAIVVVIGPGSFTGIRVGLSTAKGLAQAGGIPLIGISRLRLLAYASRRSHALVALDAGRGEYYAGEYIEGGMIWEKLLRRQDLEVAAAGLSEGTFVVEQGTREDFGACQAVSVPAPDAADALRCSLESFLSRHFAVMETLDGNYLRRSGKELFGAADPHPSPKPGGLVG